MKKRILLIVSAIIIASMSFGQTSNEIIDKNNASIPKLKTIFERAFYDVSEVKESSMVVKDVISIYVDLDPNNRFISLSIYIPINDNVSTQKKLNFLNTIAKDVVFATPYYSESGKVMVIKTYIMLEGGNTEKNIILTEKLFVTAITLILTKDTDKIINL